LPRLTGCTFQLVGWIEFGGPTSGLFQYSWLKLRASVQRCRVIRERSAFILRPATVVGGPTVPADSRSQYAALPSAHGPFAAGIFALLSSPNCALESERRFRRQRLLPIRPDVRLAGHDLWEQAFQRTHALLGDHGPAAELMEYRCAGFPLFGSDRGSPIDQEARTPLGSLLPVPSPLCGQVEPPRIGGRNRRTLTTRGRQCLGPPSRLAQDFEKIVRRLSERNAAVLTLRAAEFEWKEIADLFGVSVAAVRNSFFEGLRQRDRPLNGIPPR
jgi:hypothetical protein